MMMRILAALLLVSAAAADPTSPAYDLVDRLFKKNPAAKAHFHLSVVPEGLCSGASPTVASSSKGDAAAASATTTIAPGDAPRCFKLSDAPGGGLSVQGSSIAEVTAGIGAYLREYGNMTIGWPRGGGSNVYVPASWPKVGAAGLTRQRVAPWSYMMNVCTHSYSLVWYSWDDWQGFIDWMALSGINLVLAMTGQEEVQYKVFRKFGLNDTEIRRWFNGPAFLTWSRGQNEYGARIAGTLPRSWMKGQWALQKQILGRYRELGIVGQVSYRVVQGGKQGASKL